MTLTEAMEAIHRRPRGMKRTLSRICVLMERLGNPQNQLRILHIAGSNGKGSAAAMLASVLKEGGYKAGLFISPYILEFRERFQIDGKMIPEEKFAYWAEKVLEQVNLLDQEGICCTEFECCTAIAFCWLQQEKCDAVVLETGLGGKNDATNLVAHPLVSVIMALSLEHTALLGNSIEDIATEKAGIIKKGGRVVVYPIQQPEALGVIYERCAEMEAVLYAPNPASVEILGVSRQGTVFRWDNEEYEIPLAGQHQAMNAVTVLETLRAISDVLPVSRRDIRGGLAKVHFPVRFETVAEHPAVVLDGAHNPQGAQVLAQMLAVCTESPKIGMIGMLADKDWRHTVEQLAKQFDYLLAVPVPNPRPCVPPDELAEVAGKYCKAEAYSQLETAWEQAGKLAGKNGLICGAGSLFLAAELRKMIVN